MERVFCGMKKAALFSAARKQKVYKNQMKF